MSDPGTADLSADVDFSFLKQTIRERSGKLYANRIKKENAKQNNQHQER